MIVHTDCRHFDGYKPCRPHKLRGVHCDDCPDYSPVAYRVLFLKTGAAGEVIRNTPLLHRVRELWPRAEITWTTLFPELIPDNLVDRILPWNWQTAEQLAAEEFDLLLSLDKDRVTCALAGRIRATEKRGFGLDARGRIVPIDPHAEGKWLTGIFDDLMRAGTKSYVAELYDICGWEYRGEGYILPEYCVPPNQPAKLKKRVALHTGAGPAWVTKRWSGARWTELVRALLPEMEVWVLGGPDEDALNRELAAEGAYYPGVHPLRDFLGLLSTCNVVVVGLSLAAHAGIALRMPVILLCNIENPLQYDLFGQGEVLLPNLPCTGCFKTRYDDRCPAVPCLDLITAREVAEAVGRWPKQSREG